MSVSIFVSVPRLQIPSGCQMMLHIQWVVLQERNLAISMPVLCLGGRHYLYLPRIFASHTSLKKLVLNKAQLMPRS